MIKHLRRLRRRLTRPLWQPPSEPQVVLDNALLAGKNVLVTGAGRNIGRSIAHEMARQGANIYFTELNAERRDQLLQELRSFPVYSQGFLCNSTRSTEIDQLCAQLDTQQTTIDILVNNVGMQIETVGLRALALEEWRQTFESNLFGPLYLTRQIALNMMAEQRPGSILFITSIHQWEPLGWPSYSASKAALGMLIKELAVELAAHSIRVNGIAPGWVAEDERGAPRHSSYSLLHQTSIPPRYIGRAALFLAADYFSALTTGTVLTVDAGMLLYGSSAVQRQR